MPDLDLTADAVALTVQLVDIESVSKNEQAIADAVEAALRELSHLTVSRHGNTVVARTDLGRGERASSQQSPTSEMRRTGWAQPIARRPSTTTCRRAVRRRSTASCCTASAPAT